MGEVERIHPTLGSTFGHDLGQRVTNAGDRHPKKHHHEDEEPHHEDALELHEEGGGVASVHEVILTLDSDGHLDLSA